MIAWLVSLAGRLVAGGAIDRLSDAYRARHDAQTERDRIAAEVEIARIESARGRGVIYDLLCCAAAAPLIFHLACVALVSALPGTFEGWVVHALPAPMNDWQGQIILGLFGLRFMRGLIERR